MKRCLFNGVLQRGQVFDIVHWRKSDGTTIIESRHAHDRSIIRHDEGYSVASVKYGVDPDHTAVFGTTPVERRMIGVAVS